MPACQLTELDEAFCAHCRGDELEHGTPLVGDETVPWLLLGFEGQERP